MKRIKLVLNITAITIAIAGAIATSFYMQDNDQPQYIPVNNAFAPVGDFGTDYNCHDTPGVCTYYQPDPVARPKEYSPHRIGKYVPADQ
ncbi:hypothetical protein A4H97_20250 [Niastella yeongjuensis]|uniref:Uncharacterized protein n=1 Tax=Niastella yeongjuensis TaxID=354355 RepID=A0A1V9FCB6_9BACT|nr:DUF6520 family protein [Niastella yeongjuensis]OQP55922.1 hypothetical protein A4H97_20250 [Niastella yeongjuensis]SEP26904.1 hypothetical protein SAMN05660816_05023 [Niastella yeongjuensis]